MNEKDNLVKNQRPKVYRLAIASPLMVAFGFIMISLVAYLCNTLVSQILAFCVSLPSVLGGLVIGIIADNRIYKSQGRLKGRMFSILGVLMAIITILYALLPPPGSNRHIAYRIVCGSNF